MQIDSTELKEKLKGLQVNKNKDIIERCFNRGIWTAIKLIEIYEESERLFGRRAK